MPHKLAKLVKVTEWIEYHQKKGILHTRLDTRLINCLKNSGIEYIEDVDESFKNHTKCGQKTWERFQEITKINRKIPIRTWEENKKLRKELLVLMKKNRELLDNFEDLHEQFKVFSTKKENDIELWREQTYGTVYNKYKSFLEKTYD